uniref:Phosphatidylinositol-specific phospholipase C X domain-containing protein n=1 Tax=Timema bartmani TaxID=61472 RepID=A0A7R9F484_9NEOP|nr:unnamed protein product [Timema bartmani]
MGNDASCGRLHVRITVSPLIFGGAAKYLEVSWDNATPLSGDWVGLFNQDPVKNGVNRALFATRVKSSSGWAVTKTRVNDVMKSKPIEFNSRCLGVWVAYVKADNTTVLTSNCLRTRPTWMMDMKEELSPMKLRKVFIPGAHDAGAYERYKGADTPVSKYSITQEEDVLSQLTYGIRYLDLRVGFYPFRNPVWWVNHGVVRLHPLQEFLDDVKKFVRSTQEIVLLDVHGFPVGFNYDIRVHQKLLSYLRQQLGDLATPTTLSWDSTLREVWGSGRRLVLSYNKKEVVDGSDILWPAVAHKWGNVDSLDDLYDYLVGVVTSPPTDTSWSAMAELTANALKIALDSLGGLRKMAHSVNRNVTEWYSGDLGVNANIVAVDFFRGTAIVDAAIDWNSRRAGRMKCPNATSKLSLVSERWCELAIAIPFVYPVKTVAHYNAPHRSEPPCRTFHAPSSGDPPM